MGKQIAQPAHRLAAESLAEELAEIDVFGVEAAGAGVELGPAGAGAGPGPARCPGPHRLERAAVAVVHFPLFRVVQHVEGPLDLLKLLRGRFVVRVHVGMVLPRQLAIGLLDVGLRGVRGEIAQVLVIVFCHHVAESPFGHCRVFRLLSSSRAFATRRGGCGYARDAGYDAYGLSGAIRVPDCAEVDAWHRNQSPQVAAALELLAHACLLRRSCIAGVGLARLPPGSHVRRRRGIADVHGHRRQDPRADRLPHAPGRARQEAAKGRADALLERPFRLPRQVALKLPVGKYTFQLQRGPEYYPSTATSASTTSPRTPRKWPCGATSTWRPKAGTRGDLYVRRPVRDAELLMMADDLHVAQFVTWWNDKSDWGARPARPRQRIRWSASTTTAVINAWPAAFPAPAPNCSISICRPRCGSRRLKAEYPSEMKYLLKARENPDGWVDLTTPYCWDLPMLVALGQVDSIEVLNSRFCRRR